MVRLLHVSDLHLTWQPGERDYGLDVLDEIVELASPRGGCGADLILFAGHLFDPGRPVDGGGLAEREELALRIRAAVERLGCPAVAFAAEGEPEPWITASGATVLRGRQRLVDAIGDGTLELCGVAPSGGSLALAAPPAARSARHRVAVAHASWPQPSAPAEGADPRQLPVGGDGCGMAVDPDELAALAADYVALGSAHTLAPLFRSGPSLVGDPGSARVTAAGEPGARSVLLVELGVLATAERMVLARAGQRRVLDLWLRPDGSLADPDRLAAGRHDTLDLRLHGWLQTGVAVAAVTHDLRERVGARVRRVHVDASAVASVRARASEALCGHVLAVCSQHGRADRDRVWMRTADLALQRLVAAEEKR